MWGIVARCLLADRLKNGGVCPDVGETEDFFAVGYRGLAGRGGGRCLAVGAAPIATKQRPPAAPATGDNLYQQDLTKTVIL